MNKIIAAAIIAGLPSVASAQTAIKCVGATEVLPTNEKRPETRIYLLNDAAKTVSTWDATSEASVPYCVNECTTKYGAKHIRIVEKDPSGSLVLDIERTTGAIMDLFRGGSKMETFEGTCSKTTLPKPSAKAKF